MAMGCDWDWVSVAVDIITDSELEEAMIRLFSARRKSQSKLQTCDVYLYDVCSCEIMSCDVYLCNVCSYNI